MSIFDTVKQLKDLREQAKKMQELLATIHITEKSSDGNITVTLNGNMEVEHIQVNRQAYDSDEKLQDALKETCNTALKRAQTEAAHAMRASGGLNIPGLT